MQSYASGWLPLFASAWLALGALTSQARYVVVSAVEMYNPAAAAEADFGTGVIHVNAEFEPDPNADAQRQAQYARYVVAHELGHSACWQTARDASEACADAHAIAAGYPPPR